MKRKKILLTVLPLLLLSTVSEGDPKPDAGPAADPNPEADAEAGADAGASAEADARRRVIILNRGPVGTNSRGSAAHHFAPLEHDLIASSAPADPSSVAETKYTILKPQPRRYVEPPTRVLQYETQVAVAPASPTYEVVLPPQASHHGHQDASTHLVRPHLQPHHPGGHVEVIIPEHHHPQPQLVQQDDVIHFVTSSGEEVAAAPQQLQRAILGPDGQLQLLPAIDAAAGPTAVLLPSGALPLPESHAPHHLVHEVVHPQQEYLVPHQQQQDYHVPHQQQEYHVPHPHDLHDPKPAPEPVYLSHPDPRLKYKKKHHGHHHYDPGPPKCAKGNAQFCIDDYQYPKYEVEQALMEHYDFVRQIYKDAFIETDNSVDELFELEEETYICKSVTAYIKPLRAVNAHGQWKVIVNNVKLYHDTLTQSARVEECLAGGEPCPITPPSYDAECVQKAIYHRFLTFDPYDYEVPFGVDVFKLPSSCACYAPAYSLPAPRARRKKKAAPMLRGTEELVRDPKGTSSYGYQQFKM